MSEVDRYFDDEVVLEFRAFWTASSDLVKASISEDSAAIATTTRATMLAAKHAALGVHHMLDCVVEEPPTWLPANIRLTARAREWMQRTHGAAGRCAPEDEFDLLGDIADCFKHFRLRDQTRPVPERKATLVSGTGWSQLRFGEGNFGGHHQVVVTRQNGTQRALTSVLQNCMDSWRTALGRPLPDFGE